MSLSRFLSLILSLLIIMMWVTFLLIDDFPYYDVLSLLLVTAECFVLIAMMVSLSGRKNLGLVFMFVAFNIMFFILRFYSLFFEPGKIVNNPQLPTVDQMNITLLYLVLGSLASWMGFWAGLKEKQTGPMYEQNEKPHVDYSPVATTLLLMFFSALYVFAFFTRGHGRYGFEESQGVLYNFAVSFIDLNVMTAVFIALVMEMWRHVDIRMRLLFLVALPFPVLHRLFIASKASIVDTVLLWMVYVFARRGNPRVNIPVALLLGIPGFILALLTFYAGAVIRPLIVGELTYVNLSDILWALTANQLHFGDMVMALLSRFEGLDSLLPVVAEKGQNAHLYVNMLNEVKSLLNTLLPGKIFPVPNMGNLYPVVYLNYEYHWFLERAFVTTSMWTYLGIFYVHFGFLGGLVALGFATYFYSRVYERFNRFKPETALLLKMWLVYDYYWFLTAFGLDYVVQKAVFTLGAGAFFISVVRYLERSGKGRRSALGITSTT